MSLRLLQRSLILLASLAPLTLTAQETPPHGTLPWIEVEGNRFLVPDGWRLEVAAPSTLAPRPITASFDDDGNLYVADSSGSNAPVQEQLANPDHRILKLSDSDRDGRFDSSTLFADRMMFPEGTLFHAGSLYVSAPPQIWKLTDTDADGVADQREVWFDGKTLTGCANDLHGPYLGPDGWIYWCKGAFAEQTYTRLDGSTWTTLASHIFRRRPEGGVIEAVMTGGMDNPVDVAFSLEGERFFTTTFLTHPGQGQRDGVIHAIYGGLYGKDHGVIEGHPRTGELMPPLVHLGAAAPSGLALIEPEPWLDPQAPVKLAAACFNLHQIMQIPLVPSGATYTSEPTPWLTGASLDFHPTDVIPDADGSLLVVDTGGWYKLCCPTSQLDKPDVLGAIYRLIPIEAQVPADPRGLAIAWTTARDQELTQLLDDDRPFVRERVIRELASRGSSAIVAIAQTLDSSSIRAQQNAIWTLCRISGEDARAAIRRALWSQQPQVFRTACHAASIHRDGSAVTAILTDLAKRTPAERRAAFEALGRCGDPSTVTSLLAIADALAAQSPPVDRIEQHSLIYALYELGAPAASREAVIAAITPGLTSPQPFVRTSAAIALDQLGVDRLLDDAVITWLASDETTTRQTAEWIVSHRGSWGARLASVAERSVSQALAQGSKLPDWIASTIDRAEVSEAISQVLVQKLESPASRDRILELLTSLPASRADASLIEAAAKLDLRLTGEQQVRLANWAAAAKGETLLRTSLPEQWKKTIASPALNLHQRIMIAAAMPSDANAWEDSLFTALLDTAAKGEAESAERALVALRHASLTPAQREQAIDRLATFPPSRLDAILDVVTRGADANSGAKIVSQLIGAQAEKHLTPTQLRDRLAPLGDTVLAAAAPLFERETQRRQDQAARLTDLLARLPAGDIRRGQALFHAERTACIRCHQMGYLGGATGPDLTRIGAIRARQDLLEAIVFPSTSFVRSYEPWNVETIDGGQFQGILVDQSARSITLASNATQRITIERVDIATMTPGETSIMPSGFDQQLSEAELADLLAFLEASK